MLSLYCACKPQPTPEPTQCYEMEGKNCMRDEECGEGGFCNFYQ